MNPRCRNHVVRYVDSLKCCLNLVCIASTLVSASCVSAIAKLPPQSATKSDEVSAAVVPQPMLVQQVGSPFLLKRTSVIVAEQPNLLPVANLLAEHLRVSTGYALPIRYHSLPSMAKVSEIILTTKNADLALGSEGYTLRSDSAHVVVRGSVAGVFYGTQTLRQLFPPQIESPTRAPRIAWSVPGVIVRDKPRFQVRGLMLDSSRHLQSVAFIKRTIDRMAFQKLNTFHWHLTDDQGWRIEIKQYPKLTGEGAWRMEDGHPYGGYFTQAQIRDIVAFAAARNVNIVPEIDIPGHSHIAIAEYPTLACGTKITSAMCPGKESTYTFVENVLREVMSMFPSPVIHVGGDECDVQEWKSCPECQEKIKQFGLKNETGLQSYFERRIGLYLAAHGRRLQGWNEILNGGALPNAFIVQQWNDPNAAVDAIKGGHDVVVSTSSHVYFDSSIESISLKNVYSFDPMPAGLNANSAGHILGVEGCLWTETKPTDSSADEYIWPRECALAEIGWTEPKRLDWPDFRHRLLTSDFPRLGYMGLGAPSSRTLQDLVDRSAFNEGPVGGTWEPAEMSEAWKTVAWDVTKYVKKAGKYTFRFQYESGADGIAIRKLDLLQDGAVVGTDIHDGWAGGAVHGNRFTVNLPTYSPNAKYSIRAELRSDGGIDSHGTIHLAP